MMEDRRNIFCCGCGKKVNAWLTNGADVYPHRPDLSDLPFWKCDACGNFVGCHHKTKNRTHPLGAIPTQEIKRARQHIHRLLDPVWQSGKVSRKDCYGFIADALDRKSYHTANIRTIEEAREVYKIVRQLKRDILGENGVR